MHTRQWVIGLIPYRHRVQPALMKHIGLDVIWRALIATPCGKEHMDHRAPLQHSWTIWPGHWAFYHHRGLSSWTAETSSCLLPAGLASSLSSGKTGKDLLRIASSKILCCVVSSWSCNVNTPGWSCQKKKPMRLSLFSNFPVTTILARACKKRPPSCLSSWPVSHSVHEQEEPFGLAKQFKAHSLWDHLRICHQFHSQPWDPEWTLH